MSEGHSTDYQAFISYRHLELDSAVAERLQRLLESYRPPKGIGDRKQRVRVFRDRTELPTSGDLDDALRRALLGSRFLVVVLSEHTIDSKWCMAEIDEFKAAHHGRIDHILPLIVSGEPQDVIPPSLRFELRESYDDEGNLSVESIEVEPLCADVRARTTRESLSLLKTEFLRIAAPIHGCGFDDLYRRHLRRQRRRTFAGMTALGALAITFGAMAYQIRVNEQLFQHGLVDAYTQQGSTSILAGSDQEALAYFAGALEISPDTPAARSGALMLMQQHRWPHLTNQRAQTHTDELSHGSYYDKYFDEEADLILLGTDGVARYALPWPHDFNPRTPSESREEYEGSVPYVATCESLAVVRYGDYVYCYDLAPDNPHLAATFDLADLFAERAESGDLAGYGYVWVSDDGSLVAIDCGYTVAVVSVDDGVEIGLFDDYEYCIEEVVFDHNGKYFALVYGNYYGIDYMDPGGYVRVYDRDSNLVFDGRQDCDVALQGASFSPDDSILMSWGSGTIRFLDLAAGEPFARELRLGSLEAAGFQDGKIVVADGRGSIFDCVFSELNLRGDDAGKATGSYWKKSSGADQEKTVEVAEGLNITRSPTKLQLVDDAGDSFSTVRFLDDEWCDRLYVHKKKHCAFVWRDGEHYLFRIGYDEKAHSLSDPVRMPTRGYAIVGLIDVADGLIAITGNGYLLYYHSIDTDLPTVIKVGLDGQVEEAVVSDRGILALLVKSARFVDATITHFHDVGYEVELWDLPSATRFAEFETGNERMLGNLVLDDAGNLSYQKGSDQRIVWRQKDSDQKIVWRIDAPDPNEAAIKAIQALSCFEVTGGKALAIRETSQANADFGNWSSIIDAKQLTDVDERQTTPETESERLLEQAEETLRDEGPDAWLAFFDGLWDDLEAGKVKLDTADQQDLFRAYTSVAMSHKELTDRVGKGVALMAAETQAAFGDDPLGSGSFDTRMTQLMVLTDAYDETMASYWDKCVDVAQEKGASDNQAYYEAMAYGYTITAGIIRGEGIEAYQKANALLTDESLLELASAADYLELLCESRPLEAASAFDEHFAAYTDPEGGGYRTLDFETDLQNALFDVCLYERCGAITSADLDRFMDEISHQPSIEILQLTPEQREAGLRIGDLVIAIDGRPITTTPATWRLVRERPEGTLTILRGKETFDIRRKGEWTMTGKYRID